MIRTGSVNTSPPSGAPRKRDRYRAVLLVARERLEGDEVARRPGRSPRFVGQWAGRYRRGGPAAMTPGRAPGRRPELTPEQVAEPVAGESVALPAPNANTGTFNVSPGGAGGGGGARRARRAVDGPGGLAQEQSGEIARPCHGAAAAAVFAGVETRWETRGIIRGAITRATARMKNYDHLIDAAPPRGGGSPRRSSNRPAAAPYLERAG